MSDTTSVVACAAGSAAHAFFAAAWMRAGHLNKLVSERTHSVRTLTQVYGRAAAATRRASSTSRGAAPNCIPKQGRATQKPWAI